MNENLYAVLESRFPSDRASCCIEVPDGATYSWRDFTTGSARIAQLLTTLALPPGARVLAYVEKSPEALMLYLATLRAGLVFVPLNSAYRDAELGYLIDDARPSVVICATKTLAAVAPIAARAGAQHIHTLNDDRSGSLLDAAAALEPDFNTVERGTDDPAAILFTSGTTGRSKGAVLSHGNLAANVRVLHDAWCWRSDDVLLHVLPIFHAHGLFIAAHGALFAGAKMIWMPRFEAVQAIGLLPRSTVMMGVPTHYVRLLAEPALDRTCCRNMRVFISGSAPLGADTFETFRQRTGHTLLERYGMTETLIVVSHAGDATRFPRIASTVGLPLPGVELRIVDESGQACPVGTVGEIQLKGPSVFKGYWGRPAMSSDDFTPDDWLRTGDLARWGGSGAGASIPDQYVSIVGRRKDLIISGGFNVYPKEVEDIINEISGVAECAVIGAPHPDFGEAVVAVVVPAGGAQLNAADLQAGLKLRIASFKVPKRIHFATDLPRNAMGKVQKNVLRQLYGGGVATTTPPAPAIENVAP